MKLQSVLCALLAYNFIYETSGNRDTSKHDISERIVGGGTATSYEFPWLVSIQVNKRNRNFHVCGGTILNSQFVLTAAHCLDGEKELFVLAGKFDLAVEEKYEQNRSIIETYYHGYDPLVIATNIAIIKLNEPLNLDMPHVAPGNLPVENNYGYYEYAVLAGWGKPEEESGPSLDKLRKAVLPLLDINECKAVSEPEPEYLAILHDCQICTAEEDGTTPCEGDDGSPLMCVTKGNDEIIICGIFALSLCGKKMPAIYTDVSCHVDWILDTINNK